MTSMRTFACFTCLPLPYFSPFPPLPPPPLNVIHPNALRLAVLLPCGRAKGDNDRITQNERRKYRIWQLNRKKTVLRFQSRCAGNLWCCEPKWRFMGESWFLRPLPGSWTQYKEKNCVARREPKYPEWSPLTKVLIRVTIVFFFFAFLSFTRQLLEHYMFARPKTIFGLIRSVMLLIWFYFYPSQCKGICCNRTA